MGQAEFPVHMLKSGDQSVKNLGVQLDEPEDEKITVTDTAHLGAEDLDLRVEGFGRGIGRATPEVVEDSGGVVLESLDYRAEVVVGQC